MGNTTQYVFMCFYRCLMHREAFDYTLPASVLVCHRQEACLCVVRAFLDACLDQEACDRLESASADAQMQIRLYCWILICAKSDLFLCSAQTLYALNRDSC